MRSRDQALNDELLEGVGAEGPALELPGDELQVETIVMALVVQCWRSSGTRRN